MKKKSKFQERLDEIAKNYDPEGDRGSLNDKLKLHKMDDPESGGIQRRASQTAQPPNFLNLQRWVDVKVEKPPYYQPINIWCGDPKEVLFNWSRVSNGDKDYYVNAVDDEVIYEISHWSPPPGVIYPKYEPLTEDDIKVFTLRDINDIIKEMELKIIPDKDMPDDRDGHQGFNTGIERCVSYLKRVAREGKLKLHTPSNTGT